MEFLSHQINEVLHKEDHEEHKDETSPTYFPIVDTKETYYYEDKPELVPGTIVHYFQGIIDSNEKRHRFVLLQVVGGLSYIFRLGEISPSQTYGLNFKTDEYEYAAVNLSEKDQVALGKTIAAFIESVSLQKDIDMQEINISPANAGYTAEEIENCIEEILASPGNKLSKEEITSRYKGFQIFDVYHKLFNKDFNDKHYNDRNKAPARARYFKNMFRKYLPGWQIDGDYGSFVDFSLIKKKVLREGGLGEEETDQMMVRLNETYRNIQGPMVVEREVEKIKEMLAREHKYHLNDEQENILRKNVERMLGAIYSSKK